MEHISGLITQPSPKSIEPTPTSTSQTDKRSSTASALDERTIAKVWKRMARIYGHRWISSFGSSDDGTWAGTLRGMTQRQVVMGFIALERRDAALVREGAREIWPPAATEFKGLIEAEERGRRARKITYRALPAPKIQKDVAAGRFQEMRKVIASARGPTPRQEHEHFDARLNDEEFEYYRMHGRFPPLEVEQECASPEERSRE